MICPRCGHSDASDVRAPGERVCCGECGARIAFGVLQPDVKILPAEDRRFLVLQMEGRPFTLDRAFAWGLALELLSVLPPADNR